MTGVPGPLVQVATQINLLAGQSTVTKGLFAIKRGECPRSLAVW